MDMIWTVPLKALEPYHPFNRAVWMPERITRSGVARAIREGRFERKPFSNTSCEEKYGWDISRHESRVAHLVVNPAPDPVDIDIGIEGPPMDGVMVEGNHRMAAAVYRYDTTLQAVVSGLVDRAYRLLQPRGIVMSQTVTNGNLCTISYEDIRNALEEDAAYTMQCVPGDGAEAVIAAVNQGIDAHLEACFIKERGDNYEWVGGRLCCVVSRESLPTLIRRLLESEDEASVRLGDDILCSLNFDETGKHYEGD